MTLSILFIMDPPERILVDRDTTFVFMLEAQRRGHRIAYTRREWLWHEDGRTMCRSLPAKVARRAPPDHVVLGAPHEGPLEDHEVVFVRTDPPFDMGYVELTWLLDAVDRRRTLVVNEPAGIRGASEKLYTLRFPDLTPRTLVTRDVSRLTAFLEAVGGRMVVKPVDRMGGYGVFVVDAADPNRAAILEVSTADGREACIAQEYLPEAQDGDKRVIVLDGEPIGATLRVPPKGEHRGNIHVGAATVKAEVDETDRRICARLAPSLRKDGLYFVGLDVIGGKLTEVNVTSPTGVQEIDRQGGVRLEAKVMDFVEARAPAAGPSRGAALRDPTIPNHEL